MTIRTLKPVIIDNEIFVRIRELCRAEGLGLAFMVTGQSIIHITCNSMQQRFPATAEQYYASTVQLLRARTGLHWMSEGSTDSVGYFAAYMLKQT